MIWSERSRKTRQTRKWVNERESEREREREREREKERERERVRENLNLHLFLFNLGYKLGRTPLFIWPLKLMT